MFDHYLAKKRRQRRAQKDSEFQTRMAVRHKEIHLELVRALDPMMITSNHELAMMLLHVSLPRFEDMQAFGFSTRSIYEKNSLIGLILCLEFELNRMRPVNDWAKKIQFPYPYETKYMEWKEGK